MKPSDRLTDAINGGDEASTVLLNENVCNNRVE